MTDWTESSFTIGQAPPVTIVGVSIEPNPLPAGQNASAVVDYGEVDSNDITLYFRWIINGNEMTDDEYQGTELDAKFLKMGDRVMVQVSDDEEFKGTKWFSPILTVTNNAPVFTTEPYAELQGQNVLIKFEAEDADGDNLTYSITDAPAGTAKTDSGYRVNLNQAAPGEYTMTIGASDGKGGVATYEVTLTVPEKGTAPEAAPAEPEPAGGTEYGGTEGE
jgi:hypothetical protein